MLRPIDVTSGVIPSVRITAQGQHGRHYADIQGVARLLPPDQQEQNRAQADLERAISPEERAIDFRRHVAQHHARRHPTQGSVVSTNCGSARFITRSTVAKLLVAANHMHSVDMIHAPRIATASNCHRSISFSMR